MLRKIKGFTLIELMVVVAIIGILAAIAIPNYIAWREKLRQKELQNRPVIEQPLERSLEKKTGDIPTLEIK